GDPALFDKLTIFWHPKERPPLRQVYRELIALRKQYPAFRTDGVTWLKNSEGANVVTLMRSDDKNDFVVVVNLSNRPLTGSVDVPHAEEFKRVKIAGVPDGSGFPNFKLNGFDWEIFRREKPITETKN